MGELITALAECDVPLFRRFYETMTGPSIDVGAYAAALKYSTSCKHVVVGKPTEQFYLKATEDLGVFDLIYMHN